MTGQSDPASAWSTTKAVRTLLGVPLLIAGGRAIGCISAAQVNEVKSFSADDIIALLESFAAQAVIAIENVRQFRELQTRLEREAATREILSVISQSRNEEAPVFDVILENAARLCTAPFASLALCNEDRTYIDIVSINGASDEFAAWIRDNPIPMTGELTTGARSVVTGEVQHVADLSTLDSTSEPSAHRIQARQVEGMHSLLAVPLIRDGIGIGFIGLYRTEISPFTEAQIDLIQTFAAQAVIAIENVRQFRELQTRLEREAATREILSVISRNPDDDQPVFDVILENAAKRLCAPPMQC